MATAAESRIRLLVDALERRDGMGLLGMTAMPEEVEAVNESRRESLKDPPNDESLVGFLNLISCTDGTEEPNSPLCDILPIRSVE